MMNNGLNETNDEIKLDSDKLKRMLQKVYRIERENTKTGSKTEKKMKEEIEAIIEEEAKKCYWRKLSIIILDRLSAIKK